MIGETRKIISYNDTLLPIVHLNYKFLCYLFNDFLGFVAKKLYLFTFFSELSPNKEQDTTVYLNCIEYIRRTNSHEFIFLPLLPPS